MTTRPPADPNISAANPPPGFAPLHGDGFSRHVGPLFWRMDEQGFRLGFRVAAEHCNVMGPCHGGMVATLMDMQLGFGSRANDARVTDHFLPTISLQLDYMAAPAQGAWVMGRTEVLKVTRNLVFAQAMLTADDELTARGSGVFKIGKDARGSVFDIGAIIGGG